MADPSCTPVKDREVGVIGKVNWGHNRLSEMSAEQLAKAGYTHHCSVHTRFWQGEPEDPCCDKVAPVVWRRPRPVYHGSSTMSTIR